MKKFICLLMVMCLMVSVTGCFFKSSVVVSYGVDTGDTIDVGLDNTDNGYSLTTTSPFEVKEGDKVLVTGCFIPKDDYDDYCKVVDEDEGATILGSGTKDGNDYIFWGYESEESVEWNYAISIGGTNTGVILGCIESRECAESVFNSLTFSNH